MRPRPEPTGDRRSFLKPIDLEALDRKVRQEETKSRRLQFQVNNFEATVVPPMLSFPSGGGSGGSVGWEPLPAVASFPITTLNSGGQSLSNEPYFYGNWCFDDNNVFGLGSGALVVPRAYVGRSTLDYAGNYGGLVVHDATNINTSVVHLPSVAVLAVLPTSYGIYAVTWDYPTASYPSRSIPVELRFYDAGTTTWTLVASIDSQVMPVVGNDKVYAFGTNGTMYVLTSAAPTTPTAVMEYATHPAPLTISSPVYRETTHLAASGGGVWWRVTFNRSGFSSPTQSFWAYRADSTNPASAVTYFVGNITSSVNVAGHVDAGGNLWTTGIGTLMKLSKTGALTTYANVLPTSAAAGAPATNNRSQLVAGNDNNFYFGSYIQADAVGGAANLFRASVWEVTTSGSGTVWIDPTDAGHINNTGGSGSSRPFAMGLNRYGDKITFAVRLDHQQSLHTLYPTKLIHALDIS